MPTTATPRRRLASRVQNPLETYLREINETALLTAQEEKDLSNAIHEGDNAARDRMVRANLRLVVNIARAYTNKGLPPTPIASPGRASLEAALAPEAGDWLYYVVTTPDGHHSFATTFKQHQANIKLAQERGLR